MKRASFILPFLILTLNKEIGAFDILCNSDNDCLLMIKAAYKPKCFVPFCHCLYPGKLDNYDQCTEKELISTPKFQDEAARIGKVENCTKTEDCQRVKMSVCKSGSCECPDARAMSTDRTSCLPKARNLDDECTESAQCKSLGSAICAQRRCRCEPEHHYTASSKRCVPDKDNELDSADSGAAMNEMQLFTSFMIFFCIILFKIH
ncbi:uncharacterized protein LOC106655015 isoform X2 [Trichogramma pretiosum]|nr:uncharacterized protein LOC106655015 isoform X2 [Trichogramma pretiosum]